MKILCALPDDGFLLLVGTYRILSIGEIVIILQVDGLLAFCFDLSLLGFDNVLLGAVGSVLLCGGDLLLGADGGVLCGGGVLCDGCVLIGDNGSDLLCDGFRTIHTIGLMAGISRASSLSTSSSSHLVSKLAGTPLSN